MKYSNMREIIYLVFLVPFSLNASTKEEVQASRNWNCKILCIQTFRALIITVRKIIITTSLYLFWPCTFVRKSARKNINLTLHSCYNSINYNEKLTKQAVVCFANISTPNCASTVPPPSFSSLLLELSEPILV